MSTNKQKLENLPGGTVFEVDYVNSVKESVPKNVYIRGSSTTNRAVYCMSLKTGSTVLFAFDCEVNVLDAILIINE